MKLFIKKYKYVLLFLIFIVIISYICFTNYSIIENNTNICSSGLSFLSTDYTQFKKQNTQTSPSVTFYNYACPNTQSQSRNDNCIIGFYTGTSPSTNTFITDISSIDAVGTSIQEKIDYCAMKANETSNYGNVDFFTIDKTGDNCNCYMYSLNTNKINELNAENNGLVIKSSSVPSDCNIEELINFNKLVNNKYDNYHKLGFGGFTKNGYNKIGSGLGNFLRIYDPVCDNENNQNKMIESITECIKDIPNGGGSCDTKISQYKTITSDFNKTLGDIKFSSINNDYSCKDNNKECLTFSFEDGKYLGNVYNTLQNNSMTDSSYAEFSKDLKDYEMELALEKESKLETTSTYIKYLFLIIVIIITVIMFILNITNPDTISAEILIGYIIFLVLLIFVTSNYFNVDYGPLNKFFIMKLADAGDRNIFQNTGFSS